MFLFETAQLSGIETARFFGLGATATNNDGSLMVTDVSGARGAGVNVVGCGGGGCGVRGASGAGGARCAGVGDR